MNWIFVSAATFEPWDWTNPDLKGIGGSETSHIEMAQRLQDRGQSVLSFAPTPFDEAVDPHGVTWRNVIPLHGVQETQGTIKLGYEPDVWVVYRWPSIIPYLPDGANIWLVCQDVDYLLEGNTVSDEHIKKLSRIVCLCDTQKQYWEAVHPASRGKVFVSSNGIKTELIRQIANEKLERNPHRLMYASSPDRGLEFLIPIFERARELVRDLELHVYYGFDNIEKIVSHHGEKHPIALNARRLQKLIDREGVINHGRMGQPALLREWFQSGIWCHPSNFTETSCITSMDAQACGAIPISNPLWAVRENVQHGVFIEGNVNSELIRARYVSQLVDLALQPMLQQRIRAQMMPWARNHFHWERFVDQWLNWAKADLDKEQAA